jgi:two-component system phosphate regulon sensor histidine kinase PhoR
MRKFLLRITVVLMVVILLPVSFYVLKQLTNLSENEKIVKNVFDKQLETILFTLNQTSENIVSNWMSRIDLPIESNPFIMKGIVDNLLQNNQAIYNIELVDVNSGLQQFEFIRSDTTKVNNFRPHRDKINSLTELLKDGYQRIESFSHGQFTILYFLFKNRDKNVAGILYIHTKTFIEQNLGASFQSVAQEAFNIQIVDKTEDRILYSVGDKTDTKMTGEHKQDAWYIPGIEFRIQLRAATIDSLIKERSQKDNYSLMAILVVVLFGLVFLIVNIKKEIVIAEMKSEFVSNVSHEIRTPLALISMYSETLLLKRVKSKEKEEEYLNVIHLESNRLSEMVNRILTFSKMEKMKRKYHCTEVDINELIDDVLFTFTPHFQSMSVECDKSLENDIPLLKVDKEAVTECVINLLDNAIKYGRGTGKKIWIRTYCKANSIFIEVEDNGIGISKKHIPYIFDKFYRVTKGNLAHQAKGSGIGLNIVRQIIKSHNGKVQVKSKPGEGSCFSLVLPL